MRDNLKEHIANQREDFEVFDFEPSESWKNISERLEVKKRIPWGRIVKMGIAACLIMVTGIAAFHFGKASGEEVAMQEWEEAQQYYELQINTKLSLVKSKLDDPMIMADMEAMDEAIGELKRDLKDQVDNEEVVEAMMENYRLKLKILESILFELNKDQNEDHEIHL
jgi:hypothetical protein